MEKHFSLQQALDNTRDAAEREDGEKDREKSSQYRDARQSMRWNHGAPDSQKPHHKHLPPLSDCRQNCQVVWNITEI